MCTAEARVAEEERAPSRGGVLQIFSHTQVHVVAIVINRKNESIPRGLAKLKIQDSQV